MNPLGRVDNGSSATSSRVVLWICVVAWAGVIFWFSSKPGSQIPGKYSEIGHLGEYFIFGTLLYWAFRVSGLRQYAMIAAVVIASLYGVTDEFHQRFVPMRTPDPADWGLDTIGATVASTISLAIAMLWQRRAEKRAVQERQ
jgi:VanZ family protein